MAEDVSYRPTRIMGALGLVAGAAIAVGVPWAVLAHGARANLGSGAIVPLSLAGIGGGVILAAVSIYIAIVTPRRIDD